MKIHRLGNCKLTPEVLLHQLLEELSDIKCIAVVVLDNEQRAYSTWTNMKTSELTFLQMQFQRTVLKEIGFDDSKDVSNENQIPNP